MTGTDQPLPPDPHIAWSAFCLVDTHIACENPAECGCHCHQRGVDDDQAWGPLPEVMP